MPFVLLQTVQYYLRLPVPVLLRVDGSNLNKLKDDSNADSDARLCAPATQHPGTQGPAVAAVATVFGYDELVSAILTHVDDAHIQQTILTLSRVFPRFYFPLQRFLNPIILRKPERCVQLHRRLRGASPDASLVQELRIQSWTVDAEVVSNLLEVLDDLRLLALFVGPNFPPDVLLRILEKPRDGLETLMIRFRPYVQRPNYYQFHAGIYFDSSIEALAKWRTCSLRALSITQDPLVQQHARSDFAQPLVFFNLQPFLELSISKAAKSITSLRIRVPGRDVTPFISAAPHTFPSLKTLDLSTANIRGPQLVRLLSRFDELDHLRLDGCATLAGRDPAEWESLGRECALAGAKKAREREKAIKLWWSEASNSLTNGGNIGYDGVSGPSKKPKGGRKGLATATISIRGAKAPDLSVAGASSSSVTDDITQEEETLLEALRSNRTIRVLPFPIRLCSLTAHALPPIIADPDMDEDNQNNSLEPYLERFTEGWNSGVSTLRETWSRLQSYSDARFMIVRLTAGAGPDSPRLIGLQPVGEGIWRQLGNGRHPVPIICFCSSEEGGHAEDCGHRATADCWDDKDFLDAL